MLLQVSRPLDSLLTYNIQEHKTLKRVTNQVMQVLYPFLHEWIKFELWTFPIAMRDIDDNYFDYLESSLGFIGSDINVMITFTYYGLWFLQKRVWKLQIVLFPLRNGSTRISYMHKLFKRLVKWNKKVKSQVMICPCQNIIQSKKLRGSNDENNSIFGYVQQFWTCTAGHTN